MSVNGYNSNQFHSGPGGALAATELELVQLYALLAKSNLDYAQQNILIASKMGLAASIADQEAGQDQAQATRMQAIQSSVQAGVTAGSAVATLGATWSTKSQADAEQADLNKLQKLDNSLQQARIRDPNLQLRQQNLEEDEVANNRINELKGGMYAKTNTTGTPSTPKGSWEEEINQRAIDRLNNPEDVEKIQDSVQKQISNKYEAINAKYSRAQQITTQINEVSQTLTQISGATTQFIQANWQAKQGMEQANAALANTSSSMANSALENERSQNASFFGMIASVLQALKAASSAYAA